MAGGRPSILLKTDPVGRMYAAKVEQVKISTVQEPQVLCDAHSQQQDVAAKDSPKELFEQSIPCQGSHIKHTADGADRDLQDAAHSQSGCPHPSFRGLVNLNKKTCSRKHTLLNDQIT